MQTQLLNHTQIDEAAALLKKGGLVAFPTETVYGLGAQVSNEQAVKKVYEAKGRPSDNPLIVHVDSIQAVRPFVSELSDQAIALMQAFWPGSLTIVLPIKEGVLSPAVTGGLTTCAFRMPDQAMTRQLIALSGPLVGPSANTSGKPSPTKASHVYHDLHGRIEAVLDGGETKVGLESTVIEVTDTAITILRPGAISADMIQRVVQCPVDYDKHLIHKDEVPKAPGMKYKHYAPNCPVEIVMSTDDLKDAMAYHADQAIALYGSTSWMGDCTAQAIAAYSTGETTDSKMAAKYLFDGLRTLDDTDATLILAQGYEETDGLALAYMNRLKKSAAGHIFLRN